ncbi:MAG: hypothetical protein KGJ07_10140, partial [Patescibacteria group bacterium]|nr:hypothetical protein [Patescibacteria group bacterium]
TIRKIHSFANLPPRWYYGEGQPIAGPVIDKAVQLIELTSSFKNFSTNARPSSNGAIIITLSMQDHFLDITVNPNLSLDMTYEIGTGQNYSTIYNESNVFINNIFSALANIQNTITR